MVASWSRYDPATKRGICSVWAHNTDWIRNIRVRPALQVQIGRESLQVQMGRESFVPEQRFLC
jgi:hypothetical protein